MTEKTITVEGYFGKDKQLTALQYTSKWRNLAYQLGNLTTSREDHKIISKIITDIDLMAGRKFEELRKIQNGGE